jgi:hypothetical protein
MSDIEGKAAREAASEWSRGDASDIDGQSREVEWSFRKSDIEGKVARVAARKRGRDRVSNKRERMSQDFRSSEFRRDPSFPAPELTAAANLSRFVD